MILHRRHRHLPSCLWRNCESLPLGLHLPRAPWVWLRCRLDRCHLSLQDLQRRSSSFPHYPRPLTQPFWIIFSIVLCSGSVSSVPSTRGESSSGSYFSSTGFLGAKASASLREPVSRSAETKGNLDHLTNGNFLTYELYLWSSQPLASELRI